MVLAINIKAKRIHFRGSVVSAHEKISRLVCLGVLPPGAQTRLGGWDREELVAPEGWRIER